jgi:hypothetical protein
MRINASDGLTRPEAQRFEVLGKDLNVREKRREEVVTK